MATLELVVKTDGLSRVVKEMCRPISEWDEVPGHIYDRIENITRRDPNTMLTIERRGSALVAVPTGDLLALLADIRQHRPGPAV